MRSCRTGGLLLVGFLAFSASALATGSRKERKLARNQARLRKIFDALPDARLSAMNPEYAECTTTYATRQASFTDAVRNLSKRKFNKNKFRRMFNQWSTYCRCMVENAHNLNSKTESLCWKRRFRKRSMKKFLKSAMLARKRVSKRKYLFKKRSSHHTLLFNESEFDNAAVHASIIDIPGYFPDNESFFDAATCRANRRTSFLARVFCEGLGTAGFFGVQAVAIGLGIVDLVDIEPSVSVPQVIRQQMSCAFGPELDDVRLTFNARDPITVIIDGLINLVVPDRPPSAPNTNDLIGATAFANKIRLEDPMDVLLASAGGRALIRHELYHVLQWKNQAGNANLQTSFGRLLATSLTGYAATKEFCLADFKYPCPANECDGYYCQSIALCNGGQVLNSACAATDFDAPSVDPRDF